MVLPAKQKQVLDYIIKYIKKYGSPPTYQILCDELGYAAKSSVQHHIEALVRKGLLTKDRFLSSGVSINVNTETKKSHNHLPILGKVAAGQPIDNKITNENIEVPAFMRKGKGPFFVLEVSGDSMIDEGILDGDYVVIRQQQYANNGEIVVAEIEEEATIKRFYKKRGTIELHSANEKYKPIILKGDKQIKIAGIYCGLLRK